jgi:hypothetical protein
MLKIIIANLVILKITTVKLFLINKLHIVKLAIIILNMAKKRMDKWIIVESNIWLN